MSGTPVRALRSRRNALLMAFLTIVLIAQTSGALAAIQLRLG